MKNTIVLSLLLTLNVVGCSSDSGGTGSTNDQPIGSIGGTGAAFSLGTVTTFGSIVVNGVRYDTANATFIHDGTASTESDLDVGDVVLEN